MRIRRQQRPGITSPEMVEEMVKLRDKGLSYGEIAEHIYDKYGVSLDNSAIMRRIKKYPTIEEASKTINFSKKVNTRQEIAK